LQRTYVYVFVISAIAISVCILGSICYAAGVGIQALLTAYLHLSTTTSGYLSFCLLSLTCLVIAFPFFLRKDRLAKAQEFLASRSWRTGAILWICLAASAWPVIELTYTADLTLSKNVAHRTQDRTIEAFVRLGGSTSAVSELKLSVFGKGQELVKELKANDLGKGLYVAEVDLSVLQSGVYEVRLEYPHLALSPSSPFVQSPIKKTQRFVLIE